MEEIYKNVINLYFQTQINDSTLLSQSEVDWLINVSSLNSEVNGQGVLTARAMVALWEELMDKSANEVPNNKNQGNKNEIRYYLSPNPASLEVTITGNKEI